MNDMGSQHIIRGWIVVMIGTLSMNCHDNKKTAVSEPVVRLAKEKLQYALENSTEWEKVHAAEYILDRGYPNNVHDIFIGEERQYGHEPYYRIGLWRVLNQAATTSVEKNKWLDSIAKVYEEHTSLDRVHAAESLAKLKVSPYTVSVEATDSILGSAHDPLWAYTYWGTAHTSEKDMQHVKDRFMDIVLRSEESTLIKRIALYALCKMKNINAQNWDLLISRTLDEHENSPLYTSLLICSLANAPKDSLSSPRVLQCKEKLKKEIYTSDSDEVSAPLAVYEDFATVEDVTFLKSFMEKGEELGNMEITMAAANAILGIAGNGK